MDERVQNAIARIKVESNGTVISRGTASLVGANLVLTALHVVAERGTDPLLFLPGEISLTFPDELPVQATVLDGEWDAGEDWALLRCTTQPPETIRPLPLATIGRDGDNWETHGFPEAKPDGLTVGGIVRNSHGNVQGHRAYQLLCDEAGAGQGLHVSGLSGAPVIIDKAVVGVIRWAMLTDDERDEGGTLYACPASLIAVRCPDHFPEVKFVSSAPPATMTASRKWLAAAAVLALSLVAAYLVGRSPQPPPTESTEIVIDTSQGMDALFDRENKMTKIQAAVAALGGRPALLHPSVNLALRGFGGECNVDENSKLLVSFGMRRREPIVGASERLQRPGQLGGRSTLLDGVIWAIADVKSFPNSRRVVVLTGSADACYSESDTFKEIQTRVANDPERKVDLEMRFIGLGVPPEDEARLTRLGKSVGAQVFFTHNLADLNEVLDFVLVKEPVVKNLEEVSAIQGRLSGAINEVVGNLNARKFDETRVSLDAARGLSGREQQVLDLLAGRDPSAGFQHLVKLGKENAALVEPLVQIGLDSIQLGKALGDDPSPENEAAVKQWNESVDRWNEKIEQWNDRVGVVNTNIGEMNELIPKLAKEALKRGSVAP